MMREEGESSGKRRRTEPATHGVGPLSDIFTNVEARRQLGSEYSAAAPYPHGVISPLCRVDGEDGVSAMLTAVKDEIVANVPSTFKETDLFKLYQTTDLANIDSTQPDVAVKVRHPPLSSLSPPLPPSLHTRTGSTRTFHLHVALLTCSHHLRAHTAPLRPTSSAANLPNCFPRGASVSIGRLRWIGRR
jgi:hypothetical protein